MRDNGNIRIIIINNSGIAQKIEIFNAIKTLAEIKPIPEHSFGARYYGTYRIDDNPALNEIVPFAAPVITFCDRGHLYLHNGIYPNGIVIQCQEYPYRALLQYIVTKGLYIEKIRMTLHPEPQIVEEIDMQGGNVFGEVENMMISPSEHINTSAINKNIIDVPIDVTINGFSSFVYNIVPDAVIFWNMFCHTKKP